jgi:hypothetical protein
MRARKSELRKGIPIIQQDLTTHAKGCICPIELTATFQGILNSTI